MRIDPKNTQALLVDIQERLFPHMYNKEILLEKTLKLIKGLNFLDIPIILNEQYPKGLGHTLPQIANILKDKNAFEKTTFSCCKNKSTLEELKKKFKEKFQMFLNKWIYGQKEELKKILKNLPIKVRVAEDIVINDKTIKKASDICKYCDYKLACKGEV